MAGNDRYRVDASLTSSKVYEDEALVINTATGRYFALEGSGSDLWVLLADGTSAQEAADALAARYDVDTSTALAHVEEVLHELLDDGLIRPHDGPAPAPPPPANGRRPYVAPTLTRFTDMEELLAADPPLPADYTPVWEAPGDG